MMIDAYKKNTPLVFLDMIQHEVHFGYFESITKRISGLFVNVSKYHIVKDMIGEAIM